MKKYFLHDGKEQQGPYDLNELKEKKISKETQIWYEGLESWTKADNIDELKDIFKDVPPPFTQKQSPPPISETANKPPVSKKRKILKSILIVIASLIGLFIVFVFGSILFNTVSSSPNESYEEKVMSVEEVERATPTNFLSASLINSSKSFWGDKIIINGAINSSATVTIFKDAVVRIQIYSKTQTVIGTEEKTIYELIRPRSTQEFEIKINNYSDFGSLGLEVIAASPY